MSAPVLDGWRTLDLGREEYSVAGKAVGCVYPTMGRYRAMLYDKRAGTGPLFDGAEEARRAVERTARKLREMDQ